MKFEYAKGFTIVELLVTVSIFVFMTALVISKYGNFNQNSLLTNLAYDVALTMRTAQTFGVSVKSTDNVNDSCHNTYVTATPFQCVYGIHFDSASNTTFTLYSMPITSAGTYTYPGAGTADIYTYQVRNGNHISDICTTLNPDPTCVSMGVATADVYFKRPDSSSHICIISGSTNCNWSSIRITVASDANPSNTRSIVVYKNGQISVGD